jgi:hypothetical protein
VWPLEYATPFSAGIIVGSAGAAPLGQRFGRAAVGGGALAMTAAIGTMIALIVHYRSGLHAWQLAPSLAVASIAFGTVSGTLADVVLKDVPPRLSADASGVINTVTEFGSVLAIAAAGGIYFAVLGQRPGAPAFTHAASTALWYLALCCAASAAGAVFLPGPRPALAGRTPAEAPARSRQPDADSPARPAAGRTTVEPPFTARDRG